MTIGDFITPKSEHVDPFIYKVDPFNSGLHILLQKGLLNINVNKIMILTVFS